MTSNDNSEMFQAIYWLEKFIKEGFVSISQKEKEPNANQLLLSIKKQNLRHIENFKNQSLQKIAALERENTILQRKLFDFSTLPISEFKPKSAMTAPEKEALRIDSISHAKQQFPDLF